MKLHHTILAAALLAVASPAFAEGDDAALIATQDMFNSLYVTGDVFAEGTITGDASSSALVDQDQVTLGDLSFGDGDNDASVSGSALSGAIGNIGANVAAGVGNAQANDAALATADATAVFATAQVFSSQTTAANGAEDGLFFFDNVSYDASIGDDVLSNAAGNIGVNVAAGVGNAQGNALAASINGAGAMSSASSDAEQFTLLNSADAAYDLDNTASVDGLAMAYAVGNIGANVAAGVGNAQHNGLSIAIATGD